MNAKMVKGVIHRGSNGGYAIVADDYPIFAFGKTIGLAQSRFIKACHAYDSSDLQTRAAYLSVGSSTSIEQPVYGIAFMP